MKFIVISSILIFNTLICQALKSDHKFHLTENSNHTSYKLSVDEGFHFNIQAPCYLINDTEKIVPLKKEDKNLEFSKLHNLKENARIEFYVCDDAKTVCEQQSIPLSSKTLINKESKPKDKSKKSAKNKPVKKENHFIVDDYNYALNLAQIFHKNILIDFTASWCPACIRLVHETFPKLNFDTIEKNYILVKLDVDQIAHQELIKKYNINAFPSLVITNENGDEIDRLLDYVPTTTLEKTLATVAKDKPLPLNQRITNLKKGDLNNELEIAQHFFKALQYKEAIDWFTKAQKFPIEYYIAKINLSDDQYNQDKNTENKDHFIEAFQAALKNFPESFYSIEWRTQYAQLLKENQDLKWKEILLDAKKVAELWIANPEKIKKSIEIGELQELTDLTLPEIHFSFSEIYTLLEQKDLALTQENLAIQKILDLKPNVENPTLIIYLVHYLKKSHPIEEIEPWLVKLETAYPQDFTYFQRHALLYLEKGMPDKALTFANKADSLSYGVNKFKTGLTLAKIYKALNKNQKSKTIIETLLNSELGKLDSSKKTVSHLNAFLNELKSVKD